MEMKEGISYSQFPIIKIAGISHEVFMQKLSDANGNKSQAARILGITRAGLYKKIRRLGL